MKENTNTINPVEMDCLAMEYRSIQSQIDNLNDQLETVKDKIKAILNETEDYKTETFHFVYKIINSSRFDSAAFKKDNPVIAQQYMKNSPSRPLKVL